MGYRAHTVTQHREYGSSVFSDVMLFIDLWDDLDEFIELNVPEEWASKSENEDYYEVSIDGLKQYIEHLDVLPKEDKNEFYTDYTNKEVIESLRKSIEETKEDFVSWEWF